MVGLQAEKPEGGSGMEVRGALMSLRGFPKAPGLDPLSPGPQCLSRKDMPRLEGIRPGAPGLAFLILSHPATRDENTASLLRIATPKKSQAGSPLLASRDCPFYSPPRAPQKFPPHCHCRETSVCLEESSGTGAWITEHQAAS